MRILQLTVHYAPNIGGVETHLIDLVTELAKRKNDVFVLTYRPLVAKTKWNIFEKKDFLKVFRLPWLPGFFYKFNTSPILQFLYLLPGLFIVTPFIILFHRPSVIHAHGLIAGFIAVFWSKIFHRRVVVSTHSLYHFPKKGIYFTFVRWIFSQADKTLCLSNQSVEEIQALGIPREKIVRFTYWVDTEIFKPYENSRTNSQWKDKFVVLFVGRLIIEKGIRELLKAAEKIDSKFLFVIIGDGPLAEEIKDKVNENSHKIVFLQKLENTKLPEYYNSADMLIVPSIHDEGFGRVILESLACGTPVIGANRGAIPEALDPRVGELITITPENIVKSLQILEKDNKKLQEMKKNARAVAMEKYSAANIEVITATY